MAEDKHSNLWQRLGLKRDADDSLSASDDAKKATMPQSEIREGIADLCQVMKDDRETLARLLDPLKSLPTTMQQQCQELEAINKRFESMEARNQQLISALEGVGSGQREVAEKVAMIEDWLQAREQSNRVFVESVDTLSRNIAGLGRTAEHQEKTLEDMNAKLLEVGNNFNTHVSSVTKTLYFMRVVAVVVLVLLILAVAGVGIIAFG